MPRRKKRWWKPKIDTKSLQSVIALFFILLGLLLIVTFIGSAAGMDNVLQQLVFKGLGYAAVLLPLNMLFIGFSLTKMKNPAAEPRLLWGSVLLTLSLALFFGSFTQSLGGWIGNNVAFQLGTFITPIGSFLTGLIFIIIALLILLNASLEEFASFLSHHLGFVSALFDKEKLASLIPSRNTSPDESVEHVANAAEESSKLTINTKSNRTTPEIEILDEENTPSQPAVPQQSPQQNKPPQPMNPATQTSPKPDIPYQPPPLSLLSNPEQVSTDMSNIEKNAQVIERTLDNFGIQARIAEVNLGPSVTQYALDLAEGVRSSKITGLQNDLALALASPTGSVRIEAPIPGKRLIGIEVPNETLSIVSLKNILQSKPMQDTDSKLAVALGEDVGGEPIVADVGKWPHILIAGATGAGKSALLHSLICSILYRATPEEVSFVMVDPKRVEFTQYDDIPHLQTSVIVDAEKTVNAFKWAVDEMEKRYKLLQQVGARNLADFNAKTDTEPLPYIIMVVDELADLMAFAANDMETYITRIAQKARATGIFMILATQRPSVDVITGLIKANVPSRIALNVSSGTDSRVILDSTGAEKLLGRGDMLYLPPDAGKPRRIQSVYMSDEEIHKVTEYLKQFPSPYRTQVNAYSSTTAMEQTTDMSGGNHGQNQDITDYNPPSDDKFDEAVKVILNHDKASASLLQRRLSIGYARAARLLDELQERGIVSEPDGSNPRDVYREAAVEYMSKYGDGNPDEML